MNTDLDTSTASLERLAEALRIVTEGPSLEERPEYSDEVNARLRVVGEHASHAVQSVPLEVQASIRRLVHVAAGAPTNAKRVVWLHRAADLAAKAFGPHSACERGCSHCCHIPVRLSAAEARIRLNAVLHGT